MMVSSPRLKLRTSLKMALQEECLLSEAEDWVGEVDLVGEVDSSLPMLIPIGIPISRLGESIDEIYHQGVKQHEFFGL
jgi:hypothetical protein